MHIIATRKRVCLSTKERVFYEKFFQFLLPYGQFISSVTPAHGDKETKVGFSWD